MLQRPSTLLTILYVITLLACIFSCNVVSAQQTNGQSRNETDVVCHPFGKCERCPEDALHQPFCQPFGNRRLVHCIPAVNASQSPTTTSSSPPSSHPQGEIPAWESCGRIVAQERADFWEFVACIIFFAAISLFILFARSRRLQALQARRLAARIGIVRGAIGG